NIIEKIGANDYIECIVENLNFTPYINSDSNLNWRISIGSGDKFICALRAVDGDVEGVYKPELIKGRWFVDGERTERGYRTAVITQQFSEKYKLEKPIGSTIILEGSTYEIVGILSGFKNNPLEESEPSVIFPLNGFFFQNGCDAWREFGVRVKPGYEEKLINDFYHEFRLALTGGKFNSVIPLIYDSSTLKARTMKDAVTELTMTGIPAIFLLIFTILGVIGINLMDVKSRMHEFALRISVGATIRKIVLMIFCQNFVIGFMSLIPGVIIILYANDFAATALCAIGVSVVVVLLLAIVAVIYPAVLISKINPSVLLKEE
ncbi:MAG: ABC transporter permease, partial [Bacteroidales bacterium]|nr:ABC transporter permease [Bacteroidales bacterium]